MPLLALKGDNHFQRGPISRFAPAVNTFLQASLNYPFKTISQIEIAERIKGIAEHSAAAQTHKIGKRFKCVAAKIFPKGSRQPKLGKIKSRGLSYPGPDFVYGKVCTVKDGGAAEALSNWYTPSLSLSKSAQYGKTERDFVALNREGLKSGLVTAKDLKQYRATHDIRRQEANKIFKSTPAKIPQDITFGVPSQPSTPMSELLEYRYGQKWLEEQQAKDRALMEEQNKKLQLAKIQDTRTTLLRKSRPLEKPPSMWKLPKFQKIGPALDTFRDPEAREKAMAAHYMDSVARRGLLGQERMSPEVLGDPPHPVRYYSLLQSMQKFKLLSLHDLHDTDRVTGSGICAGAVPG
ncbi:Cilia- and flagella-associated protein 77 [Bagarius yarrelli]|uniref:Cilia-and flagella-associated protein 77 n=1 Tax=Bagarius yarrelli TaxID=175774 RepID=A0A556V5W7_BAGYA|nr:Cilia- and flagella-associated protein 77 [Bagarius yarrelli]